MDPIVAFLSSTLGIAIEVLVMGIVAFLAIRSGGSKSENVFVLERIKYDVLKIIPAKLTRPKRLSDLSLKLADKRDFSIPDDKQGDYARVDVKRTIKKGSIRLFLMDIGQIVKWPEEMADKPSPLMDHATISAAMNRASARRLANPKLDTSQLYLYLIMGAVVGISLGYIIYPQVNHPIPIIEFCTRLANGTVTPRGCPG